MSTPTLGAGFSPLGAGLGAGLGGGLFSLFSKNPADAANPYMNQIPDILKQYLGPYAQMGQQVMPTLQQQYMGLIQDPTKMMNQIGKGFQASPGYQYQVDQATRAANQAAAAGGMAGSPMNQYNVAKDVQGLANQDYYNYMNMGLNQYGQGLGGLSNLNQLGFNASSNLGEDLARMLESQANLAYSGQANQNQAQGGLFGGLGGLIGGLFL